MFKFEFQNDTKDYEKCSNLRNKQLTKMDIPFYQECNFGYYEWFVKKEGNRITIQKVATLAPFKEIISNDSYKLDIKYSPELNEKDKFLDRNEGYEIVEKYWKETNTGYMKIII